MKKELDRKNLPSSEDRERGEFEIIRHQIDSEQLNEMILKGIEKVADQNS